MLKGEIDMSNKIMRILGKRGRITIPYEIRVRNGIRYNDVLSFEEKDKNTIIVRKEKICSGCTPECLEDNESASLKTFLDNLSPEMQHEATVYLNLLWAKKEKVTSNV